MPFDATPDSLRNDQESVRNSAVCSSTPSPAPAVGAGLGLGGESVRRYFFVQLSAFQDGPWLVGLSTRPPSDAL